MVSANPETYLSLSLYREGPGPEVNNIDEFTMPLLLKVMSVCLYSLTDGYILS
jgi:hypothetical protein